MNKRHTIGFLLTLLCLTSCQPELGPPHHRLADPPTPQHPAGSPHDAIEEVNIDEMDDEAQLNALLQTIETSKAELKAKHEDHYTFLTNEHDLLEGIHNLEVLIPIKISNLHEVTAQKESLEQQINELLAGEIDSYLPLDEEENIKLKELSSMIGETESKKNKAKAVCMELNRQIVNIEEIYFDLDKGYNPYLQVKNSEEIRQANNYNHFQSKFVLEDLQKMKGQIRRLEMGQSADYIERLIRSSIQQCEKKLNKLKEQNIKHKNQSVQLYFQQITSIWKTVEKMTEQITKEDREAQRDLTPEQLAKIKQRKQFDRDQLKIEINKRDSRWKVEENIDRILKNEADIVEAMRKNKQVQDPSHFSRSTYRGEPPPYMDKPRSSSPPSIPPQLPSQPQITSLSPVPSQVNIISPPPGLSPPSSLPPPPSYPPSSKSGSNQPRQSNSQPKYKKMTKIKSAVQFIQLWQELQIIQHKFKSSEYSLSLNRCMQIRKKINSLLIFVFQKDRTQIIRVLGLFQKYCQEKFQIQPLELQEVLKRSDQTPTKSKDKIIPRNEHPQAYNFGIKMPFEGLSANSRLQITSSRMEDAIKENKTMSRQECLAIHDQMDKERSKDAEDKQIFLLLQNQLKLYEKVCRQQYQNFVREAQELLTQTKQFFNASVQSRTKKKQSHHPYDVCARLSLFLEDYELTLLRLYRPSDQVLVDSIKSEIKGFCSFFQAGNINNLAKVEEYGYFTSIPSPLKLKIKDATSKKLPISLELCKQLYDMLFALNVLPIDKTASQIIFRSYRSSYHTDCATIYPNRFPPLEAIAKKTNDISSQNELMENIMSLINEEGKQSEHYCQQVRQQLLKSYGTFKLNHSFYPYIQHLKSIYETVCRQSIDNFLAFSFEQQLKVVQLLLEEFFQEQSMDREICKEAHNVITKFIPSDYEDQVRYEIDKLEAFYHVKCVKTQLSQQLAFRPRLLDEKIYFLKKQKKKNGDIFSKETSTGYSITGEANNHDRNSYVVVGDYYARPIQPTRAQSSLFPSLADRLLQVFYEIFLSYESNLPLKLCRYYFTFISAINKEETVESLTTLNLLEDHYELRCKQTGQIGFRKRLTDKKYQGDRVHFEGDLLLLENVFYRVVGAGKYIRQVEKLPSKRKSNKSYKWV